MKANENLKDSVFSLYMTEDTSRLVEVYNAVQNENYPIDTPIEINTLQDALYKDRINDVSFSINGKIVVLMEHQSTINQNMPLRMLLYAARVYEKILDARNLYYRRLIKIPTPEFIVLYNGLSPMPDEQTLTLSSAFEEIPHNNSLELTVRVLNINSGHNQALMQKSKSIADYSIFIEAVRQAQADGLTLANAIAQAVDFCQNNNVMCPFLRKHASEVRNMLLTGWKWETALEVAQEEGLEKGLEKGLKKGLEKGLEKGRVQTQMQIAQSLLEILPDEVIAQKTGVSVDQVKKLRAAYAKTQEENKN